MLHCPTIAPNVHRTHTPHTHRTHTAHKDARGWATAWRGGGAGRLLVSLACDLPRPSVAPKTTRASAEASAGLDAGLALSEADLASEHTVWWAQYYWSASSGSFLTTPASASRVEQFHWIQVFKVGAENACRRFKDSVSTTCSGRPCSCAAPPARILLARLVLLNHSLALSIFDRNPHL